MAVLRVEDHRTAAGFRVAVAGSRGRLWAEVDVLVVGRSPGTSGMRLAP